jgi:superfamily II DNA or RNA helicase
MPANLFITNDATGNLGRRLRELISASREMRALVGFFYFSGVKVLYDALRANPNITLRVLVGMEAEEHCGQLQELILTSGEKSRGESQDAYIENLRRALRSAALDKQAFHERIGAFVELIRDGRLIIRKTREPNHAKLYLFDIAEPFNKVKPGVWISGSSNLTLPGLESQGELNLDLSDFGFAEAGAYFDELWRDAVPLTENESVRQRVLTLIDRASIVAPVTPFEAYLLVLKNYVDHRSMADHGGRMNRILEDAGYTRYTYQVDAVNQAIATLDAYNGVIVADVVGLGKTIIACLVARLRGRRGIVIAPPGLVGDHNASTGWRAYLRQFKLHDWEVRSCGSLGEVRAYVERDGAFRTVIVDEAHRFRNQNTEDYDDLLQTCRGKEVILLTATPFNNRPADLLSLLKLFLPPKNSPLVLDGNMEADFRDYNETFRMIGFVLKNMKSGEKADEVCRMLERLGIPLTPQAGTYKQIKKELGARSADVARRMRAVIEPVTIRRNRLDLKGNPDYAKEITTLSTVRPPAEQFYVLTKKQSDFYDRVISDYFGPEGRFHGAIYRPVKYDTSDDRDESQQINMFTFIRGLFVRRFESSFGAFARSLEHAITMHLKVEEFAKETGTLLVNRTFMDKILTAEDDERDALLEKIIHELKRGETPGHQQVYHLDQHFDKDHFFRDLKADIKLLRAVQEEMKALNLLMHDPKAQCVIEILKSVLNHTCKEITGKQQRKVLIFSEYADSVDHLQGYLEIALPGKVLVVNDKLSREMDRTVKANFDASLPDAEQVDDFQILLCTDRMSEGYNLNRAGLVINYDIPWNPTRVIQRVGRINRIGKKVFDNLYIFNFFPTEQGADIHRSRQIAGEKMFLIHSTIGEDVQILAPDEEPTPAGLFQRVNTDPEAQEGESFLTKAQRELRRLSQAHPELLERIAQLPPRVKTASRRTPAGVYFFRRRGAALFTLLHTPDSVTPITVEEGIDAIRCDPDEPRVDFSTAFWPKYGNLCTYTRPADQEQPASQSWVTRARMQLASLLPTVPETGRPFIELLIEDIQYFGTLSERTLRKIAKPDIATPEGLHEIGKTLAALKGELGPDYLSSYKRTGVDDQVIITVEQQQHPSLPQTEAVDLQSSAAKKDLVASPPASAQGAPMAFTVTPKVLLGLLINVCRGMPTRQRASVTVTLSAGGGQLTIIGNGLLATVPVQVQGQGQCQMAWRGITDVLTTFSPQTPIRVECSHGRLQIGSFSMQVENCKPVAVPDDHATEHPHSATDEGAA